jgi:hypothetical protein
MQDVRKERPGKNTKEIITREICIQHGITEKYVVCPQRPVFHSLNGKKKINSTECPYGLWFIPDEFKFTQRNVAFLLAP